jgi:multiple sugar transport system substrate-binding protein
MQGPAGNLAISRRRLLAMAGAGAALPLLGGAAFGQGVTGTVRVWTFLSPDGSTPREMVLKSLITSFEAANPGVSVVVEPQPAAEIEAKYFAAEAQGRAPDVIWLRDSYLAFASDRGALVNLDEVLSADFRQTVLPDFYPALANNSVLDGVRLSLPLWPSPSQVLFYRKDALNEIGLDAPPLTWPEFVSAAEKLTVGERYGFGFPTRSPSDSAFINIMAGAGPGIFDTATGRIDLTGSMAVEAAEVVRELLRRNAISPTLLNSTGDDIQDRFASGSYAIAREFSARFPQYQASAAAYEPSSLAVSAWPAFGDRPPAVLLSGYWTVGISPKSNNKAAAAAFVEGLYSDAAELQWAQVAGLVPNRRSIIADPYFQTEEAATIRTFADLLAVEGAITLPQRIAEPTKVFTVVNDALQALIGTKDPTAEILQAAAAELGW